MGSRLSPPPTKLLEKGILEQLSNPNLCTAPKASHRLQEEIPSLIPHAAL